jgi:putative membrane protein
MARESQSRRTWRLPSVLLILFTVIWLALAITPVSRQDWLLENLLVFIAVPVLVMTRHHLRFSDASYVGLFVFFVLHAIGAHYTYALVPYDQWWEVLAVNTLNELLGWERNHYDRLVHFMYGVLLLPPSVELLDKYAPARGLWRSIVPVAFVMSHSVIFELVEWCAALIVAPDLGNAYLGTQGDQWDAQQDMALATLGAVLSMLWLRFRPAKMTVATAKPSMW